MSKENNLLNEYQLNRQLRLKNKIIMAPMTRAQASDDLSPTKAMADYYARRAEAGLIITEGTVISDKAKGHHNVPGIFREEHIRQWTTVTDAVHANKGLIFLQLWHVGRVSHPHFLNGDLPGSASATRMSGPLSRSDHLSYGSSRALSVQEINEQIEHFAFAAKNAIQAGFDGVELHGANGYLIDQFLHHDTNRRDDDDYGGSVENMTRFPLAVVSAVGDAIGYERVGIRLSPGAYLNQIVGDDRDAMVFKYLLQQLNQLPIAYVHTGNFDDSKPFEELNHMTMTAFLRTHYHGTLMAAGGYTLTKAQAGIEKGEFNLVAMGRPFIANPDLIQRVRANEALNHYDVSMLNTLY